MYYTQVLLIGFRMESIYVVHTGLMKEQTAYYVHPYVILWAEEATTAIYQSTMNIDTIH